MTNALVSLAAVMAVLIGQAATPAKGTYVYNIFQAQAIKFQNPDLTACTAASTQTMLNLIYYTTSAPLSAKTAVQAAQPAFIWRPTLRAKTQATILSYARAHMTMPTSKPGSDVHGFRNALNYYGWGSMTAGVYADLSYRTYDQAVKATVRAIALSNEPVGVLSEYGGHIQIVSGYSVTGMDPRTGSTDFTVNGVFITDPLRERRISNTYVTYSYWKTGPPLVQFYPFLVGDSIYKDPIDGQIGRREWWRKYVIVAPVLPA
jgi:hypothetical protein